MDFTQALQGVANHQTVNNDQQSAAGEGQQQQAAPGGEQQQNNAEGEPSKEAGSGAQTQNSQNTQGNAQANTNQSPDFYASLDQMSGGMFKDETGFRSGLERLKNYEELNRKHEELSAQMAKAPVFHDDSVRIYNEMLQGGKSREQINTFLKLSQLGDLKDLSDKDALIFKAVMLNDSKESAALLRLNRDFKLEDSSLEQTERDLLDDDMRLAANEARKELAQYKTTVSQPEVQPEETRLREEARTQAHAANVRPYVKDVVASLPNMGEFTLVPAKEAKDNQPAVEAVKMTIPIDDAARGQFQQHLENYFLDGTTPITDQNVREALHYARAEYLRTNAETLFAKVYSDAVAKTTEALVNKYENRSSGDLADQNRTNGGENGAQKMGNFMSGVANRNVGQ